MENQSKGRRLRFVPPSGTPHAQSRYSLGHAAGSGASRARNMTLPAAYAGGPFGDHDREGDTWAAAPWAMAGVGGSWPAQSHTRGATAAPAGNWPGGGWFGGHDPGGGEWLAAPQSPAAGGHWPGGGCSASGGFGGHWPGGGFGGHWPGGSFGGHWPGGGFAGAWPGGGPWGGANYPPNFRYPSEADQRPSFTVGLGWHPESPDFRDLQFSNAHHLKRLTQLFKGKQKEIAHIQGNQTLPPSADLRIVFGNDDHWPVEDQGILNSCTAHAVVGLVEYIVRRQLQQYINLSRLFLYNASRRLLGWTGDSGSYIRKTIQAAVIFGIPPEQFWPYDPSYLDAPPDAFLFGYAASFKAINYFRVDGYRQDGSQTLEQLKRVLADEFPVAFGFPVYDCIQQMSEANIPFPNTSNQLIGGHAVLAVGYDDEREAVLIRNSWGAQWGDNGYGWLPYRYVTDQLACDMWTIFKQSWIDEQPFS